MNELPSTPEPAAAAAVPDLQADLDRRRDELLASAPEPARRAVGVFELVAVSALVAAAAVATYHYWILPRQLPRIASVDLATLYREQEAAFSRVIGQDGVTAGERDQARVRAEAFARGLPGALEDLSQACACTVLSSNAIAGRHGVIDLTAELRHRMGL